jgi:replicative superfamily II helicase
VAYEKGETRCLVSTTALGAGVNLPSTHVIVRDLTFGLEGALPIRDLLQMMGRAGRGERSGQASAILKPKDAWEESKLAEQLRTPALPELKSALLRGVEDRQRRPVGKMAPECRAAKLILGEMVRREKQTIDELRVFFDRSLGGSEIGDLVPESIRWLCDGRRLLAWEDEGGVGATALGKAVARTGIPLETGAGFATLVRDVLECDPDDKLFGSWKPLDTLLVLELLDPREAGLKRFVKDLPAKADDWIEHEQTKSPLFVEWIRGTVEV